MRNHQNRRAWIRLSDELTAEARSDDEQIWNFRQALQRHVALPCDGFVIGEPVKLFSFNYDGNQRRGVTATCRRSDGREYEVAVLEVLVPTHTDGSRYHAAYRHWMGLEPYPLDRALHHARDTSESVRDRHSAQSGRTDRTLGQKFDGAVLLAAK